MIRFNRSWTKTNWFLIFYRKGNLKVFCAWKNLKWFNWAEVVSKDLNKSWSVSHKNMNISEMYLNICENKFIRQFSVFMRTKGQYLQFSGEDEFQIYKQISDLNLIWLFLWEHFSPLCNQFVESFFFHFVYKIAFLGQTVIS